MSKAYEVVRTFEEEVAQWTGARYGVAVESCCAAIFLSLKYIDRKGIVHIPKHTYPGVPMAAINAGYSIKFIDEDWKGVYTLSPYNVIDSALRFKKDMYIPHTFWCISFHSKKILPIGRGGMILTDDAKAVEWLKMARFDGRKEISLKYDNASIIGWNMYMTPEQAAKGLTLFEHIKNKDIKDLEMAEQEYPDLSKWKCFN